MLTGVYTVYSLLLVMEKDNVTWPESSQTLYFRSFFFFISLSLSVLMISLPATHM